MLLHLFSIENDNFNENAYDNENDENDENDENNRSLPSTVDDEEEEKDEVEGQIDVTWEVSDANNKSGEDSKDEMDTFPKNSATTDNDDAEKGVPMYEVMEPFLDEVEDDGEDLDRTIGSEEEREREHITNIDFGKDNIGMGGAAAPSTFISKLEKHCGDLKLLADRATRQCKLMLGDTVFEELHALFKDRLVDCEGRMIEDGSEEKTNEMHNTVLDMEAYVVQRCGGSILEASAALFNIQRLVALEAALVEDRRNLEKAINGEEILSGMFANTPRGDEGNDTEGEDYEEGEGGEAEEEEEEEAQINASFAESKESGDGYYDEDFEEFNEQEVA